MNSLSESRKRPRDGVNKAGDFLPTDYSSTGCNSLCTPLDRPSKKVALVHPSTVQHQSSKSSQASDAFKSLLPTTRRRSSAAPSLGDADRFIPSRDNMNMDLCRQMILSNEKKKKKRPRDESPEQNAFSRHLKSTLCNIPISKLDNGGELKAMFSFGGSLKTKMRNANRNTSLITDPFAFDTLRTVKLGGRPMNDDEIVAVVRPPRKGRRRISPKPYKILAASGISDDFFYNLISWSKDNIVAVAIGPRVYLYHATTAEVQPILTMDGEAEIVTSVNFCESPGHTQYLASGTSSGSIIVIDVEEEQKCLLAVHDGPVVSLAWNGPRQLTSGGRDGRILNHDIDRRSSVVSEFVGHSSIVCGLAWNQDRVSLASGANDNTVCLWDSRFSGRSVVSPNVPSNLHMPRLVLDDHKAAIKALDWCPFDRHLLASGGGLSDKCIKFWNSINGTLLNSVDTGSQICSLNWSIHQRELVSGQGYLDNQLTVWKYPTMTKVQELKGHSGRVLCTALSPDGNSIASASADEQLNFWQISDVKPTSILGGVKGALLGAPTIR